MIKIDPGIASLLHARGEMRGLAHRGVVHAQITADRAHHDLARVEAEPDLDRSAFRAVNVFRVLLHRFLHPQRRVARPHGVILVGERRAEQRHDPVAHHLVDRALVAVDGLHHVLEDGVEELPRLLGISVGQQLHRALEVGEEDGDLLALALERGLRSQDRLGEVLGRVGLGARRTPGELIAAGAPHEPQNRLPGASSPPHCAQVSVRWLPQSSQNRSPSRFSAWHRGHVMVGARLLPDRSHSYSQAAGSVKLNVEP